MLSVAFPMRFLCFSYRSLMFYMLFICFSVAFPMRFLCFSFIRSFAVPMLFPCVSDVFFSCFMARALQNNSACPAAYFYKVSCKKIAMTPMSCQKYFFPQPRTSSYHSKIPAIGTCFPSLEGISPWDHAHKDRTVRVLVALTRALYDLTGPHW